MDTIGLMADLCRAKGIAKLDMMGIRLEMGPAPTPERIDLDERDTEPPPGDDYAYAHTGLKAPNLRKLREGAA